MNQEKLELVADFYEFTMSNGYFSKNKNDIAYFDVFFRKVPDGGGYAIVAGLEQIIEFIQNLKFDEEDIDYLRRQNMFSEEYLNYLKDFKFTGDIWAHSWIQSFDSEYEAFKTYAELYPNNGTYLIDTYHTLQSGLPNAIKVFDEVLKPQGVRPVAVRLDSGDLAYLSKKVRVILDEAGYPDCKICATNALDENLISSLIEQDAKIDLFGVGENLITAKSDSVFGGVYKLAAMEKEGKIIPKIKISENVEKITNPSFKKVYRFYSKDTNYALADVIMLKNEKEPEGEYEIFDQYNTWKRKKLDNYYVKELQEKIFENGKLVYKQPTIKEIVKYTKEQLGTIWEEIKRLENPQKYYVDLSHKLYNLKTKLLNQK